MRLITYLGRSLGFHWRSHLAVALGVMTATATLTGALLVGDSMRASLRDLALGRLGRVDHALLTERFFHQRVTDGLAGSQWSGVRILQACPAILLRGGLVHAETRARVNRITVYGADERFLALATTAQSPPPAMPTGRSVVLNEPLAEAVGAVVGDDVLVRVTRPSAISTETLLGRRDDTSMTLRLTVRGIITRDDGGEFALTPHRSVPYNAWVPLPTLQRLLGQPDRINTILVESRTESADDGSDVPAALQEMLSPRLGPADVGLRLRTDRERGYVALESDSLLIEPAVEESAVAAAASMGVDASPILTYLANTIRIEAADDGSTAAVERAVIPYSTVTGLETAAPGSPGLTLVDGSSAPRLAMGDILLNEWAANDLGASIGDRVMITYYVTGAFGALESRRASFVLRGVVRMDEKAVDPGFTPSYQGVTDVDNLADWDPPFPVDLAKVRDKDERYWDRFTTAPKAFISLMDARRLWTEGHERFGRSTSIRLTPSDRASLTETTDVFVSKLKERLDIGELGFTFEPVRRRALAASTGTTDFGVLFLSFSFFLIISAAMLIALLFGLGAEQRAEELGILLTVGFSPRAVARLLIMEGTLVAFLGAVPGLFAAMGYAWLMLAGLRSWWAGAVSAPFLQLCAPPATFVIGFVGGLLIAVASIAWSVRRLTRRPAHSLLGGAMDDLALAPSRRRTRLTSSIGVVALVTAMALILLAGLTETIPETVGFFGGGAALVVSCLCGLRMWLRAHHRTTVERPGPCVILRMGVRNAPRHPGRSLLASGLIASATFIIAAIGALQLDPDLDTTSRRSPTGGFALVAEPALPLPYDLNTPQGRDALGLDEATAGVLDGITAVPFRLRPGDETSCRGLYRPLNPRIIGATEPMIDRGGFVFGPTLAQTEEEARNPWTLLLRTFDDGAVPVIGEESAVIWQLHLGLGEDLVITDERGRFARLRFVALLSRCVLQDELIVAESQFKRLFPSIDGHAFFLIETPPGAELNVARTLERELSGFAFDTTPTVRRLADYAAVQNTYLRTFQTLGGLGLVLGTVGLTIVLLRNMVERRSELALLRALGFSRASIGRMVLAENAFLVLAGLLAGAVPALVAIAPHVHKQPAQVPWLSLCSTLAAVAVVGIGVAALALVPALRAPLLPALRRE